MSITNDMVGRQSKLSGRRRIVKLYSKRSNRLYEIAKWILIVIFSPIALPVFLLIYIGLGAERVFDWMSNVLDMLLELIVPRKL